MLGALITFLFAFGILHLSYRLPEKLRDGLDPAEALGLSGLVGIGFVGLLVLLVGLLPGGLRAIPFLAGALALAGYVVGFKVARPALKFDRPQGWHLGALVLLVLAVLFALVGALGPSDTNDWDSIAYHLAVPKIWIEHGQIDYIPYIHHSNFPGAIDNLFVLGLQWGGQAGAKAFSVAIFIFGILALFGLTRRRYSEKAAWVAALAFAGIPCVLWESGTAYIDVGHGLFAGLGILYASELFAERRFGPTTARMAICLAFACATKYTGLQTLFACGVLVVLASLALGSGDQTDQSKTGPKLLGRTAAWLTLATLLIAGPWYVRNLVNTGNPVYPFFYEVIGGSNWDAFSAAIYKEEQKTFGAGTSPSDLGAAILGLAYQPGRYTNPAPTQGQGMPTGALGVVVVGAWLAWLLSGRLRRFEAGILIATGISLLMWFVLSQQSRYLVTLGMPAAVLAGAALERLRAGPILAGLAALQMLYSLYVAHFFHVGPKLPVLVGKVSTDEYLTQSVGFYEAAKAINEVVPEDGRVALYDEVFGYYLDVPYFWANPGHSTLIPYEKIETGTQLADELKRLGFTHVYMNLSLSVIGSREARERWLAAAQGDQPYSEEERQAAFSDLRTKWRVLLAEAFASGKLTPVPIELRSGLLFQLN